jgi:hypothetical protein
LLSSSCAIVTNATVDTLYINKCACVCATILVCNKDIIIPFGTTGRILSGGIDIADRFFGGGETPAVLSINSKQGVLDKLAIEDTCNLSSCLNALSAGLVGVQSTGVASINGKFGVLPKLSIDDTCDLSSCLGTLSSLAKCIDAANFVTVTTPVTASGEFIRVCVNGANRLIRLWNGA